MGRKKIAITRIQEERNRQITFSKRKSGLLKKAYELSILCDVEIAVIMITSNKKLYQYASSNMNSILIRYTEFKDPDESKTNADILEEITKKEKGSSVHDDSGDEDSAQQFLLTPHTQENYRKIDEEFDHMLRHNQVPAAHHGIPTPLGSAPPGGVPQVMPVTVPVTPSPGTIQQQIHQHLRGQLELQQRSSGSSAGPLSASSVSCSSLISPQSELSSASPSGLTLKGMKSPSNMPPPQNTPTPTRLQRLRNQTFKLHLPGSGRNYISLPGPDSGGGKGGESTSPNAKGSQDVDVETVDVQKGGEEGGGGGDTGTRPGSKPQLRVYIPGQKEFVPRTQAASPLPQVTLNAPAAAAAGGGGGGGGVGVAVARGGGGVTTTTSQTTTSSESLTTPILSLATPNIFSSLPPIFSNLMGDFPFGQTPGGSGGPGTASGGGGGDNPSAALVAFPVSIQPSAGGGGGSGGAGNLILQAQNMGQPFLLTPTYDTRQNPLNTQGVIPPTSLPAGFSPSVKDLEQLKQQYERTQQLLQQQLLLSQMQGMFQQQQQQQQQSGSGQDGGGGVTESAHHAHQGGVTIATTSKHAKSVSVAGSSRHPEVSVDSGLGSQDSEGENQYINGADVMMSSQLHSSEGLLGSRSRVRGAGGGPGGADSSGELDTEGLSAPKRPRLDT